jgi:hypothetical protein
MLIGTTFQKLVQQREIVAEFVRKVKVKCSLVQAVRPIGEKRYGCTIS